MTYKTPEDLIESVSAASYRVASEQYEAREAVVPAIRAMETELIHQLDGGKLRGLKNLGAGSDPFYAARVRGGPDKKLLWPQEESAQGSTLILAPSGELQMAVCTTDESGEIVLAVGSRPVLDGELRAEDLQEFLKMLTVIIPRHVTYADRASERYVGLRELSESVFKLLGGTA